MTNENENNSGLKVNRGRLGSISLYEVTEDELGILERGSPNSTYLNFSIGLISFAASFFISIATTKIDNLKVYIAFWVVALTTGILGVVLFVVWLRSNRSMANIIKRIRSRISNTDKTLRNDITTSEQD